MTQPTAQETLGEALRSAGEGLPGTASGWARGLRETAANRFEKLGLPTGREETWRHTPLKSLLEVPFRTGAVSGSRVPEGVAARVGDAYRIVVSAAGVSIDGSLPSGLRIRSLCENPDAQSDRIGRLAEWDQNAFTALNTALFDRGVSIELERGFELDRPVHIIHTLEGQDEPGASFPRVLVVAREGSRGVVLEHYRSNGSGPTLTAPVTEVFIEPNARVDHIRLQEESPRAFHVARLVAEQEANSRFRSWSLAFGSRLARVEIESRLSGEGAECALEGVFAGRGTQHLDHYTKIDHRSPNTQSRERYKGIIDGRARGVFLGHILVRPNAQKINALQTSRSIVLSPNARVNMKPWLEIYADDVRCTHGTTVGRLDEDALFYLRSRGIDREAGRAILVRAFVWEVLEDLPVEPLREDLDRFVLGWLEERAAGAELK